MDSSRNVPEKQLDTQIIINDIHSIPRFAHQLDAKSEAIQSFGDLASRSLGAAITTPGRTIEIVFKEHVQSGLNSGAYSMMHTKSGEMLADAVDGANKVVGKGRIIEAGKAKQLVAGGFQLLSIAVAQAHLADIELRLSSIEKGISKLIQNISNEDRAKLTGSLRYLLEQFNNQFDSNSIINLPAHKRSSIENIISYAHIWEEKLINDMDSQILDAHKIIDTQKIGTEKCYKDLRVAAEQTGELLLRHKLLCDLGLVLNAITAYFDPTKQEFTRIKLRNSDFEERAKDLTGCFIKKSSQYLTKKMTNSDEILEFRKEKVETLANNFYQSSVSQIEYFNQRIVELDNYLSNLFANPGEYRIALEYNESGKVARAAVT